MKSNIKCSMKGRYKVEIFSGKTLMETTDWFDNDITNTGVLYPFTYPFARCFMFLSIGSGQFTEQTNGLQSYTGFYSGATPINTFQTQDGNYQTGSYMGWPFYASGLIGSSACGTQFTPSGVNLFRAWNLPSGTGAIGGTGLEIDSFMVSPSSGSDPTGCYPFSCVNQSVFIASGYNATIYYMLSLNFNDYAQPYVYFPTGISGNGYFNTGNAIVGGVDTTLVSGWANLSGIYRQLFPGIQCVDNYGGCVVTDHGAMLEPNLVNAYNLYFYLSPDISQYAVSKYDSIGHFGNSAEYDGYNSYGLCANYSEYTSYTGATNPSAAITNVSNPGAPADENTFYYSGDSVPNSSVQLSYVNPPVLTATNENLHLSNLPNISGYTGLVISSTFQYNSQSFVNATGQTIDYASPGGSLFSSTIPNYGQPAVFSTALRRIPPTITGGRIQKATKSSRISPIQALGWNARYGSLVLANINGLTNIGSLQTIPNYPYMEYLFFDTSGRAANMPHYRIIPEIYLTNRGTGVYQAVFSITGQGVSGASGSPIQRLLNVTGFMGGYNAGNTTGLYTNYPWTGYIDPAAPGDGNLAQSGIIFSGVNIPSNLTGSYSTGTYGYGAVYGIITPYSGFTGLPYDCCLLDNPVWSGFSGDQGIRTLPNPTGETGLLCWPYPGSKIGLAITGLQYWYPTFYTGYVYSDTNNYISQSGFQLVGNVTGSVGTSILSSAGAGTYTIGSVSITVNSSHQITASTVTGIASIVAAANATSGFVPTNLCAPSGKIHHLEYYTGNNFTGGYRLLPNYASGNNNFTGVGGNTYSPIRGGAFPGLSSQNGMQIYFDFIWSA